MKKKIALCATIAFGVCLSVWAQNFAVVALDAGATTEQPSAAATIDPPAAGMDSTDTLQLLPALEQDDPAVHCRYQAKQTEASAWSDAQPMHRRCPRKEEHCWWTIGVGLVVGLICLKKCKKRVCKRTQELHDHIHKMEASAEQTNAKLQKIIDLLDKKS